MLFQEFADRTDGKFTIEEDYNNANAIYMDTDMDKDQFCAIWKKYHNNPLVSIMLKQMQRMWTQAHTDAQHIHQLEVNLDAEREKSQTLIETIEQNAQADMDGMRSSLGERFAIWHDALIHAEREDCAQIHDEIRTYAIDYMGENNYLSYKITNHYDLTDADREAMVNALKK